MEKLETVKKGLKYGFVCGVAFCIVAVIGLNLIYWIR